MKKQIYINIISQIVAFALNILISFFLTPYIVNNIGNEAYGFIGLADNFISYATLITVALNSMASRFITISIHRQKYEDVNKYYSSIIVSNVVISIIFSIVATSILLNLDKIINVPENLVFDVTILWALLFFNFSITLITNVFSVATFAHNRLELSSLRNIESMLLKVAILVGMFYFFESTVWYVGFSTLICSIYTICINFYYTKKFMPYVRIKKEYFEFIKIKTLISSGIWNSISKLGSILSTGLDLLITNLLVGAFAMGTVSIAKVLPTYILSLFGTISTAFTPQLTISYAKNDFKDIKNQLISSIRLLGFFAAIPVTCLWVYGESFIALWMPTQDASIIQKLMILTSMAFPFSLSLEPLWSIFTITNKVKKSSLFLLMNSAVSIALTYILLLNVDSDVSKMCIICGASSILSVIRSLTFLPIYGAKCLKFKWYTFYGIIGKNFLTFVISILFALLIKNIFEISSWTMLIMSVVVTCVLVCIINYFIMLTKTERDRIFGFIKKEKRYDT